MNFSFFSSIIRSTLCWLSGYDLRREALRTSFSSSQSIFSFCFSFSFGTFFSAFFLEEFYLLWPSFYHYYSLIDHFSLTFWMISQTLCSLCSSLIGIKVTPLIILINFYENKLSILHMM